MVALATAAVLAAARMAAGLAHRPAALGSTAFGATHARIAFRPGHAGVAFRPLVGRDVARGLDVHLGRARVLDLRLAEAARTRRRRGRRLAVVVAHALLGHRD